ncbi:MAG: hypothetical protein IJS99_05150 [Synergistaceae bacterium]|nr:hypothetical protein [Synergistaceae bacterium]
MRFIGGLIKYFVYLCIILIAAGAALFWFDTGSWLILPLAERAGNFFLDPLKIEIANIDGSMHEGYSLRDLKLISGDEDLFTLKYASVSPDWDLVFDGMEGVPFIKSLNIRGISSDMNKLIALSNHFAANPDTREKNINENDSESFALQINPVNVMIQDINISSPYSNLALNELSLNESGKLTLITDIISRDNILPVRLNALVNLESLDITSSDFRIGQASGKFTGGLDPLKANLNISALMLEELLKFAPPLPVKLSGRLDGRVSAISEDGYINASGVVSMPRADIMGIPLKFRVPFTWTKNKIFALDKASFKTNAARLNLTGSANIDTMNVKAKGEAINLSLYELGRMFAPEVGLKGEGGRINFDLDTIIGDNIFSNTRADISSEIPFISAAGIRILNAFNAKLKLAPRETPRISLGGEVFGGKLFARGEAEQDKEGNFKPQAVISVVNLDINTLLKAFPKIAKSIQKPAGKVTAKFIIPDNLRITGKITSDKISAQGITLTKLLANIIYDHKGNRAILESLSANLGKGSISGYAMANLKTTSFNAKLNADNLDVRAIPDLKQVTGLYNLRADASGRYANMNSINVRAHLTGKNAGYSGTRFGNIDVPITYANNHLTISGAKAALPGGAFNLKGIINLVNLSNPGLDIAASTQGINIADTMRAFNLQDKSMPISGKITGGLNIKGSLNNASVNAHLRAENVKAGNLVNIPSAILEAQGNTQRVNVSKLTAKINGSDISGKGSLKINQKNFMNSALDIKANIKKLELKPLQQLFMKTPVVNGQINGDLTVKGTLAKPQAEIKTAGPIYYGITKLEDIALKLSSPGTDKYLINTSLRIDDFKPASDTLLTKKGGKWAYSIETKPLDLNAAIESQMSSLSGIVKGSAVLKINGVADDTSPININLSSKTVKVIDKVKIENINLPLVFNPAKNNVVMKRGRAVISGGEITSSVNVDLNKRKWDGIIKVSHLDFGNLSEPFMPEGEIVGKVDADAMIKGTFGSMPTSFANGKFVTTPGYIHKMDIINRVSPTKKITFEKINGSFYWNGTDLFLNPGTGARAGKDEPLYRYFTINGSAGIPGKGLRLYCDGRFDLKILDQLLGAMKGVFQYMTGGLTGNVLRDAAGRVLGIKKRDYQNVTFTLANSWQKLQLLDLKITKPIEEFLPINALNKNEEQQRQDTKFQLQLKFPAGPGGDSAEDESPADQFKQQLIDNLFNIGR